MNTLPEHVTVTRLMLTDTKLNNHIASIKQVGSTEAEEGQPDPVYNLFNLNNKQSTNPVKLSFTKVYTEA